MSAQRGDGARLPYIQWYPADFMAATVGWPLVARGAYRELLDAQWTLGSLPVDENELRDIARATPAEWAIAWRKCESKFPDCGGYRANARLEQHRARAIDVTAARHEAGKAGARGRWGNGKGNAVANGKRNGKGNAVANGKGNAVANGKRNGKGNAVANADANGKTMPSNVSISTKSNLRINATDVAARNPEPKPPRPSEATIARVMAGKSNISRQDLVADWDRWASKPGRTFTNVDAAFESFAARHEPTDDQRKRAIAASRAGSPPAGLQRLAPKPAAGLSKAQAERVRAVVVQLDAKGETAKDIAKHLKAELWPGCTGTDVVEMLEAEAQAGAA